MPDHRYRLGAATFRLGFQALDAIDIRSIARPFMEKLHEQTGETVHLGTLEDNEVVYVEKVEATRPLRLHSRIGAIATVHCTGVSKAILAFLPPTKRRNVLDGRELPRFTEHTHTTMESLEADLAASHERGFALDAEEHEPGIHCVGAPIISGAGEVAGAISVTAPLSRVDRDVLIGFVPALLAATQETSKQLGWRGP
jgi:DNA-binding IclR family transcriptional regulator